MLLLREQPVVHERYLRCLTGEAGAAPKKGSWQMVTAFLELGLLVNES